MNARGVPTVATYRLQFRGRVSFAEAIGLVPYLRALGIDTLYASPLLAARAGSTHGYDTSDPTRFDPVLGSREGFDELVETLRRAEMGLLLDVVPNHMVATCENPWWRNLLEHGRASPFAEFFDVRWAADPEYRVVLPVLGKHYGMALESGELVPSRDADGLIVRYYDHIAPLDLVTCADLLRDASELVGGTNELSAVLDALGRLPSRDSADREARRERERQAGAIHAQLRGLQQHEAEALDRVLRRLAGHPGRPRSFDRLHEILDAQAYRLAFWRSGLGELNYRRFFDIAELVALRTDRDEVFEATHALVADLVASGQLVGLRIDHVDGLADPVTYLKRLREMGVKYLIVEKILSGDEELPVDWPVDGTTGYEFLGAVTTLFADRGGWEALEGSFREAAPEVGDFHGCTEAAKLQVLVDLFSPGMNRLVQDLRALTGLDRLARDLSLSDVKRALRQFITALRVYRTYLRDGQASPRDRAILEESIARAAERLDEDDRVALAFIGRLLRCEVWPPPSRSDRLRVEDFVRRLQQLTGPVMAKGLEDTALYRYTPLLALNDVGCHPHVPLDPVSAFHEFNRRRSLRQQKGLCATASHDTKRGEDVRARLVVLSELAQEWLDASVRWKAELLAAAGEPTADTAELDLLLQTAVAAWPLEPEAQPQFFERLSAYIIKAAREAKVHTSWLRPNEDHEKRLQHRVETLFAALQKDGWGREVMTLHKRIAFHGAINSLSQLTAKIASPGIPDVYQGTELWDLSLVDPDNRRAVAFASRSQFLEPLIQRWGNDRETLLPELLDNWTDGRAKLLTLWRGLIVRREQSAAFVTGRYLPLPIDGEHRICACAFARRHADAWVIAIVPRLTTRLVSASVWPLGAGVWSDTHVLMPPTVPAKWRELMSGTSITVHDGQLRLGDVFARWPVALLVPA